MATNYGDGAGQAWWKSKVLFSEAWVLLLSEYYYDLSLPKTTTNHLYRWLKDPIFLGSTHFCDGDTFPYPSSKLIQIWKIHHASRKKSKKEKNMEVPYFFVWLQGVASHPVGESPNWTTTLRQINIDPGAFWGWKTAFHQKLLMFRVYVNLPEGKSTETQSWWWNTIFYAEYHNYWSLNRVFFGYIYPLVI